MNAQMGLLVMTAVLSPIHVELIPALMGLPALTAVGLKDVNVFLDSMATDANMLTFRHQVTAIQTCVKMQECALKGETHFPVNVQMVSQASSAQT